MRIGCVISHVRNPYSVFRIIELDYAVGNGLLEFLNTVQSAAGRLKFQSFQSLTVFQFIQSKVAEQSISVNVQGLQ